MVDFLRPFGLFHYLIVTTKFTIYSNISSWALNPHEDYIPQKQERFIGGGI